MHQQRQTIVQNEALIRDRDGGGRRRGGAGIVDAAAKATSTVSKTLLGMRKLLPEWLTAG
jgi:hypothetical protein